MEDIYTLFNSLVTKVAQRISNDFPEVQFDDLYQELFVFLLETPELRNPSQVGIVKILEKKARFLCWEIRKEDQYQKDKYLYRPSDVREILNTSFDHYLWPGGHLPEDADSQDGADVIIVHSDVSWAYEHLPEQYKKVIFKKHALKEDYPAQSAEHRKYYRAIDRLVNILNLYKRPHREGPGSRKVITNAHARHLIDT